MQQLNFFNEEFVDIKIQKILLGQFYTIFNPFNNNAFFDWFDKIPNEKKQTILEPFAGANNIVQLINSLNFTKLKWKCYDIAPPEINNFPIFKVEKLDTIKNFPKGYSVGITNPPYLSKNSATRKSINFDFYEHDDMYKTCLDIMLKNLDYVAAIIPESFITQNIFHNRLETVISLNCKMFEDTECPVCLALFVPEKRDNDFQLYNTDNFLGNYCDLIKNKIVCDNIIDFKFNDPTGEIGLICIDSTIEASINFTFGNAIFSKCIKPTSRAITRVSGLDKSINLADFTRECNDILNKYRELTKDCFMTSFKGLRKDGKYRRRLDFKTARIIMSKAVENLKGKNKC